MSAPNIMTSGEIQTLAGTQNSVIEVLTINTLLVVDTLATQTGNLDTCGLNVKGSLLVQSPDAAAGLLVDSSGNVTIGNIVTGNKLGFFGKLPGGAQVTAASITSLADLKTYLQSIGLLG